MLSRCQGSVPKLRLPAVSSEATRGATQSCSLLLEGWGLREPQNRASAALQHVVAMNPLMEDSFHDSMLQSALCSPCAPRGRGSQIADGMRKRVEAVPFHSTHQLLSPLTSLRMRSVQVCQPVRDHSQDRYPPSGCRGTAVRKPRSCLHTRGSPICRAALCEQPALRREAPSHMLLPRSATSSGESTRSPPRGAQPPWLCASPPLERASLPSMSRCDSR